MPTSTAKAHFLKAKQACHPLPGHSGETWRGTVWSRGNIDVLTYWNTRCLPPFQSSTSLCHLPIFLLYCSTRRNRETCWNRCTHFVCVCVPTTLCWLCANYDFICSAATQKSKELSEFNFEWPKFCTWVLNRENQDGLPECRFSHDDEMLNTGDLVWLM